MSIDSQSNFKYADIDQEIKAIQDPFNSFFPFSKIYSHYSEFEFIKWEERTYYFQIIHYSTQKGEILKLKRYVIDCEIHNKELIKSSEINQFIWSKFYEYLIINILASRKQGAIPISFELILLLNYRLLVCEILIISPENPLSEFIDDLNYDYLAIVKYLSQLAKMIKFYDCLNLDHQPIGIQGLFVDHQNNLKLEEFNYSKSRLFQIESDYNVQIYSNCYVGFNVPELIYALKYNSQQLISNPNLLSQSKADIYCWGLILLILFRVIPPKHGYLMELDKMKAFDQHANLLNLVNNVKIVNHLSLEKTIQELAIKCLNADPQKRIDSNKLYKKIRKIKKRFKKEFDPNYRIEKQKNKREKKEKQSEPKQSKSEKRLLKFKKMLNLKDNILKNKSMSLKNTFTDIPFEQLIKSFLEQESQNNANLEVKINLIDKALNKDFSLELSKFKSTMRQNLFDNSRGIKQKFQSGMGNKNKYKEKVASNASKGMKKDNKNAINQKAFELTAFDEPFGPYIEQIETLIKDYFNKSDQNYFNNYLKLSQIFSQFIRSFINIQNVAEKIDITILGREHDDIIENIFKLEIKYCLICKKKQEFDEMRECITNCENIHISSEVAYVIMSDNFTWNFSLINLRYKEIFLIESLISVSNSLLLIDFSSQEEFIDDCARYLLKISLYNNSLAGIILYKTSISKKICKEFLNLLSNKHNLQFFIMDKHNFTQKEAEFLAEKYHFNINKWKKNYNPNLVNRLFVYQQADVWLFSKWN